MTNRDKAVFTQHDSISSNSADKKTGNNYQVSLYITQFQRTFTYLQ